MLIDGQCHCGNIAFAAEVDPSAVRICHCTDCQTLTGSAYRANIQASAETFRLLRGSPRIYIKTAESGARRAHAFCPDCGTPIYATAEVNPTSYSLRVGTIKQRGQFTPRQQIWCQSALPWSMDLHGLDRLDRQ